MANYSVIAEEIFRILHSRSFRITMYDQEGNHVYEPSGARKFYIPEPGIMVSINEDPETSSLRFYINQDVEYAELLVLTRQLRILSNKFGLLFNFQRSNNQITPKNFSTGAIIEEEKMKVKVDFKCKDHPVMIFETAGDVYQNAISRRKNLGYPDAEILCVRYDNVSDKDLNLYESMHGTSKSSYLKLENARMIVRHSRPIREDIIGGRGRNVSQVFIENSQLERFLMPTNNLHAGRAMTQHVNQGGSFADAIGCQIANMAKDFQNLNQVLNQLPKTNPIANKISENCSKTKNTFRKIGRGGRTYESAVANLPEYPLLEGDALDTLTNEIVETLKIDLTESQLNSLARVWNLFEDDDKDFSYSEPTIKIADREWPRRLIELLQRGDVKFTRPVKWHERTKFFNLNDQLSQKLSDLTAYVSDSELGNLASWVGDQLENPGRIKPGSLKNLQALAGMFIKAAGGKLVETANISLETKNPEIKALQDWALNEDEVSSDEMEDFENWLTEDAIEEEFDLGLSDDDFVEEAPTDWLNHNGKPRDKKKDEREKPLLLTKKAALSEDDLDNLEDELDSAWANVKESSDTSPSEEDEILENNDLELTAEDFEIEEAYADPYATDEDYYDQDAEAFFENFPIEEFLNYIDQDLGHGLFHTNGVDLMDEEKTLYKSDIISALNHFTENALSDLGIPGADADNYPQQIRSLYQEIVPMIEIKGFNVIDDLHEEDEGVVSGPEFIDHEGLDLLQDTEFTLDEENIFRRAGL
jgi:hypothetical protein